MRIHRHARKVGAALLMWYAASACATPSDEMDRKLSALIAAEDALPVGADPGPPLRKTYAMEFGDIEEADLESLSDYDLRLYLRASNTLAFYTYDPTYLRLAEHAFANLESRDVVIQHDFESMFDSYIRLREFGDAAALADRHVEMEHEPLPEFTGLDGEFDGATVLELQVGGAISRVPAGLSLKGSQIVVAAHPLCHFSENAIRSIEHDPELAALFSGRTLWLMPQDGDLNVAAVHDWNRDHPDYEMRWAYQTADWPMIKRWATPNFYFYRDGKLVTTVIGWPEEGRRKELIDAFRAIGVESEAPAQASR